MASQPLKSEASQIEQHESEQEHVTEEHEDQQVNDTHSSNQIDDAEPGDQMEAFDWEGLLQDYQNKLQHLDQKEQALYTEFDQLTNFFGIWANTVQSHEVERSLKRIYTRQAHVANSESELEVKRQHYVKVVKAFRKLQRFFFPASAVELVQDVTSKKPYIEKHTKPRVCVDDGDMLQHTADLDDEWACNNPHPARCIIL